jgi:large subunit ribosomal protein L13
MVTVINAENLVLGRMASIVAKRLLEGEEIIIVNAEKAVVRGKRQYIFRKYEWKREVGSQRKGPYYPRMPDRIVRRTIRGMLRYQSPRGRTAYKRLKVFISIPTDLKDTKYESIENAINRDKLNYIQVGDISEHLGARWK